jgi:chemotaxis signal transduction protein
VVDGVEEVAGIAATDITPPPDLGDVVDVRFITGMARRGASFTTLIDLDVVAAADRISESPVGSQPAP